MKQITKNGQAGFTLIEIAIVLVIIGLLLGGVLKGQEMITQGKIKNVIADMNGIQAAYYGYQDRYRAIPGDDAGADERWTTAVATNSVNASRIDGVYNASAVAVETTLFWAHLRGAGFIPGPVTGAGSTSQPINAVGGIVGVQNAEGSLGMIGNVVCSANLPAKIAQAVDSSMDDGVGTTGQVRAMLQTATNQTLSASGTAPSSYADTGTNEYVVCKTL